MIFYKKHAYFLQIKMKPIIGKSSIKKFLKICFNFAGSYEQGQRRLDRSHIESNVESTTANESNDKSEISDEGEDEKTSEEGSEKNVNQE